LRGSFLPGEKLGPYTLIERIGQGNFSVIWLGERRGFLATTRMALKLPRDVEIPVEQVQQEARLWAYVSGHPNIVPLIDADIYDGQVVLASEYVADGSLDKLMEEHDGKAPTVELALGIVLGILGGLQHLHERKVIHRDLKPSNILLQHGVPRLVDFGVSRLLDGSSRSLTIAGTTKYMAPEAFDGYRSEITDLWSLCVIFYRLLSGSFPFDNLREIIDGKVPPLPEEIPSDIRAIVNRGLSQDPRERFQSCQSLRAQVRESLRRLTGEKEQPAKPAPVQPEKTTAPISPRPLNPTLSWFSTGRNVKLGFPSLSSFVFDHVMLDAWGNPVDWASGECRFFDEVIGDGVKLRLVYIPAGKFQMGSFAAEGTPREKPQHPVEIRAFFLGAFQVTLEQWLVVSQLPKVDIELDPEPADFKTHDALPVNRITWQEAVEFCNRLTQKTGQTYRLPTEAEWEYACRAGTGTPFSFGGNLVSKFANFDGHRPYQNGIPSDARERPIRVGSLGVPNGFGLYDMHGNVWEWCQDQWHSSYVFAPTDGTAWDWGGESGNRVIRGGDFLSAADECRSAFRKMTAEETLHPGIGFRVARSM
jgi:formylglycine-generating enzyme required for sulfatase activity/tRNA A-37 threonylcarbamoyl transferase component Bud32